VACEFSDGWVYNDLDCDDDHATANPDGGPEINFNDIDEDCDGVDYSLATCLAEAMANTAAEMENSGRGIEVLDFYNTYDLTTTWPLTYTFANAGYGEVTNQVAYIRDLGYLLNESGRDYDVSFETDLQYNDAAKQFIMTVGVVPSYWTAGAFGYTLGDIMTYLVDLVADLPEDWDGTFACYGYVDATPADFDGDMVLTIDENRGRVTADVSLESNVTSFTEGDTTLTNIDGDQCSNDIITAITGYMGIGDTYVFMNENLVQVGKELVFTYENTLEDNVAASCSAP
jgi:hypothetical protein